jgi:hypothetical protein
MAVLLHKLIAMEKPPKSGRLLGPIWGLRSDDVLPLDMIEDLPDLNRILSELTSLQIPAPRRHWCIHCRTLIILLDIKIKIVHTVEGLCVKTAAMYC